MPDQPGVASTVPARINEYYLTDSTGLPVSHMVSKTAGGDVEGDGEYHVTHAFADGLGRTVATLSDADPDPDHGDGYPWIASGDGFGRVVRTTVRVRESGAMNLHHLDRSYLPTGELTSLTRRHESGTDAVTRTMQYDSLGRMIENFEPSTSEGTLGWRSPAASWARATRGGAG